MYLLFEERMYTNLIVDHPGAHLFNSAGLVFYFWIILQVLLAAIFEVDIK